MSYGDSIRRPVCPVDASSLPPTDGMPVTDESNAGSSRRELDGALRDHFSSLQALLALALLMTESGDENKLLHLAASALPSLVRGRMEGVQLLEGGWVATAGDEGWGAVRSKVEIQLADLDQAGGPLALGDEPWAWAFPLRSLEGHFGFLVVSADAEPTDADQCLLRGLAQQVSIALANVRVPARERAAVSALRTT